MDKAKKIWATSYESENISGKLSDLLKKAQKLCKENT